VLIPRTSGESVNAQIKQWVSSGNFMMDRHTSWRGLAKTPNKITNVPRRYHLTFSPYNWVINRQ